MRDGRREKGGGAPGQSRKKARETVSRRPAARIGGGQKLQMAAVPKLPGGERIASRPENSRAGHRTGGLADGCPVNRVGQVLTRRPVRMETDENFYSAVRSSTGETLVVRGRGGRLPANKSGGKNPL